MALGIARIRTRQGIERGRDHELQIAFGENDVGVLPVQHFALFGNPDLAGKSAGWLGIDGAVRRTAAPADRSAPAVKEPQPHTALARYLVQGAVGAEDLPGAGEHAAVFVGVGISQHDLLRIAPGLQQPAIAGRLPQLAADGRRVAQIFNGFEQRNRHQARVGATALHAHAAQPRKPNHIEHIFGARSAADHVVTNGFRSGRCFQLGNRAEGIDHVGGGCGKRRRHRRGACRVTLPGPGFFERRGMQPRMLADIERLQMKTEGAHLEYQRINQGMGQPGTAVLDQAGVHNLQVRQELLRRLVCRQAGQRCIQSWARRGIANAGEPHPDAAQESPVRFILIALSEGLSPVVLSESDSFVAAAPAPR